MGLRRHRNGSGRGRSCVVLVVPEGRGESAFDDSTCPAVSMIPVGVGPVRGCRGWVGAGVVMSSMDSSGAISLSRC